jgi:uncharacterized membrane protein
VQHKELLQEAPMNDDEKPVPHEPIPPTETKPQSNSSSVAIERSFEATSGFLPGPKMLAEYEKISPGITERFFALAERELAMEELELNSQINTNQKLAENLIQTDHVGRLLAGGLFALLGTFAFILALGGNNLGAGILLSAAVVSGLKAFLPDGKSDPKDAKDPQKALPPESKDS